MKIAEAGILFTLVLGLTIFLGVHFSDGPAVDHAVVGDLRRGLHEGRRLSQMLRDRRHIFPELLIIPN